MLDSTEPISYNLRAILIPTVLLPHVLQLLRAISPLFIYF